MLRPRERSAKSTVAEIVLRLAHYRCKPRADGAWRVPQISPDIAPWLRIHGVQSGDTGSPGSTMHGASDPLSANSAYAVNCSAMIRSDSP